MLPAVKKEITTTITGVVGIVAVAMQVAKHSTVIMDTTTTVAVATTTMTKDMVGITTAMVGNKATVVVAIVIIITITDVLVDEDVDVDVDEDVDEDVDVEVVAVEDGEEIILEIVLTKVVIKRFLEIWREDFKKIYIYKKYGFV